MPSSLPRRGGPIERWRTLVDANHGTSRGLVRAALADAEYVTGRLQPHLQLPATARRLVFVCLGNINRSAFGESVARELGANTCSIGLSTTTGAPAFHKAIQLAPEFGFDLTQHRATDIGDYSFQPGDALLVMEVRHARRLVVRGIPADAVVLLGHWASPRRIHLHDPHVLSDAYFRTCFTLIRSAVQGLVGQLREAGSPCVVR